MHTTPKVHLIKIGTILEKIIFIEKNVNQIS